MDAPARWYDTAMNRDTLAHRAQRFGQAALLTRARQWDSAYTQYYAVEDSIKTTMSLRDYLLRLNAPASLRALLGACLSGSIDVGGGGDYTGADMRAAWYDRNLRIFSNILRLRADPGERILVTIGAGHAPLPGHFISNAPELRLVDAGELLGGGGTGGRR